MNVHKHMQSYVTEIRRIITPGHYSTGVIILRDTGTLLSLGHLNTNIPPVGFNKEIDIYKAMYYLELQQKDRYIDTTCLLDTSVRTFHLVGLMRKLR